MGEGIKIAYICDGLDKCSDKVGCYRHAKTLLDICTHTLDPKHAANGAVDDPALYPERFCKLTSVDGSDIRYWEGDIEIP